MNAAQKAIFTNANRVTGPHMAVVDGKPTGLAGCSTQCSRRERCLRASESLAMRVPHGGESCLQFIPA